MSLSAKRQSRRPRTRLREPRQGSSLHRRQSSENRAGQDLRVVGNPRQRQTGARRNFRFARRFHRGLCLRRIPAARPPSRSLWNPKAGRRSRPPLPLSRPNCKGDGSSVNLKSWNYWISGKRAASAAMRPANLRTAPLHAVSRLRRVSGFGSRWRVRSKAAGIEGVLYEDANDPRGIGLLTWSTEAGFLRHTAAGVPALRSVRRSRIQTRVHDAGPDVCAGPRAGSAGLASSTALAA